MTPPTLSSTTQRGFSMIEVLVTLVITAFGLLGLAGFAGKATGMGVDAAQRARASMLLHDMAGRLENNKSNAAAYVTGAVQGAAVQTCGSAPNAVNDLCQWGNLLAGANDAQSGGNAAGLGYRGCVTQPAAVNPVYVITVAWGAMSPGTPSADLCAQDAFGDDALRRTLRSQVRIASLSTP